MPAVEISLEALSKLSARVRSDLWCRMVSVAGDVSAFNLALGSVFFPSGEEEPPASREACCQKARSGVVWWERSPTGNSKPGWTIIAEVTLERRELSGTPTLAGATVGVRHMNVRNCPFCGELLRVPFGG